MCVTVNLLLTEKEENHLKEPAFTRLGSVLLSSNAVRLFQEFYFLTAVSSNYGFGKVSFKRLLLLHSVNTKPFCKWFEPRSIGSLLSVIVRVSIVLKRTVVVDND